MKALGASAFGIVVILVVIGMVFTIFKPIGKERSKPIVERQDVVLGTASHLDFSADGSL